MTGAAAPDPFRNFWPAQAECDTFYGNPRGVGGAQVSKKWAAENLVMVPAPWKMAMGDINITRFQFHRKAARVLIEIFAEIKAKHSDLIKPAGLDVFSGAFNYRLMRGINRLSMHSYGCAIDFDAPRNGLGDNTPNLANFPAIIAVFEKYGAVWGGHWSRPDGMHFQFARV